MQATNGPPTVPIDIQAERMELDQRKGSVLFEGNVQVQRGELKLSCARLTAQYADDGTVTDLLATGRVEVTSRRFTARSQNARYTRATGQLELSGEPSVSRGKDTMSGQRVLIWIDEERVVIEKARGTIRSSTLTGKAKVP